MSLWINLKRNKYYADIYIDGVKRLSIKVNENNRGNTTLLDFDSDKSVTFKIVKEVPIPDEPNESNFNREEFNK